MALEERELNAQGPSIVMTGCPKCDQDLPDGQGFSDHWPDCDENPLNRGGV